MSEFFAPEVSEGGRLNSNAGRSEQAQQKLLEKLDDVDKSLAAAADRKQQAELNARRADIVEKIAETAQTADEKAMWLRQMADMISAATQAGAYPDGEKRLAALFEKCKAADDKDMAAYVRFRQLTAGYGLSFQADKPDVQKIHKQWLESLEQFIKDYPKSNDAAEAMLQLAIANEFAGEEDEAKTWYGRIVKQFPDAPAAKKAEGARRRLDCVGKPLALRGKTISGATLDINKYRGKAVLVQYWATWCTPARTAMPALRELSTKYPGRLQVVGVNLDNSLTDLKAYMEENDLPWPQIFESGGLDSRPANEFGILTVPTMVLVDKQGKVVSRNVSINNLDDELKKLLGPASARKNGGQKIR